MDVLLVVKWEWTEDSPHAGSKFWAAHAADGTDGRLRDWPSWGLRPLAAARVVITEGEGLELLDAVQ